MREVYAGLRIFELAKQVGTVQHYIWSNLDYSTKVRSSFHLPLYITNVVLCCQKSNYNPTYKVGHYDAKGRVADWMKAQDSDTSANGMTWSVVTSGPYMDILDLVSLLHDLSIS